MRAQDIMTHHPAYCLANSSVDEVARLMVERRCGAIPVVDDAGTLKIIGIVTDRDIVCRLVARSMDPRTMVIAECMSYPAVSVRTDTDVADCCQLMVAHGIRRVPVVNRAEALCGMLASADVVGHSSDAQLAALFRALSEEPSTPSRELVALGAVLSNGHGHPTERRHEHGTHE